MRAPWDRRDLTDPGPGSFLGRGLVFFDMRHQSTAGRNFCERHVRSNRHIFVSGTRYHLGTVNDWVRIEYRSARMMGKSSVNSSWTLLRVRAQVLQTEVRTVAS